jgi:L-aspartate oxidase
MGGIVTDLTGGTNVSGLYAIGECASTGLHGANRLASNSLLEAGVMAMRSAADIKAHFTDKLRGISSDQFIGQSLPLPIPEDTIILKSAMYRLAGLVRTGSGLKKLQARIHKGQTLALPRHPVDFEAANMLLLSELIATAAINRTESRGGHFREDYPATKESFRRHQVVSNKGWSWQEHTATASAQLVRL